MFLLPYRLQRLFKRNQEEDKRTFTSEVDLSDMEVQEAHTVEDAIPQVETGQRQVSEQADLRELEIYPEEPFVRKKWFGLTIREREVAALVCMGYRNYEIASILGVGYQTVLTHLQNIFHKFNLRSRREIRAALISWLAEEWWTYHHY